MKLLLALATRGRPLLLVETVQKTMANVVMPETELHVLADADDLPTIEYLGSQWGKFGDNVKLSIKPREDTIAEKWNRVMSVEADLYMPYVDHTVIVTKGFDEMVCSAAARFPDGICAVHDQLANLSFAGHNAMSRKWVELLGEIYPTYFPYWFVDHWTDNVARMIGRIAYCQVAFDATKKPPTQEMREPGWWATWFDAAYGLRCQQANKLIDALNEPDGVKENLRESYPWVETKSRGINDGVRASNNTLVGAAQLDNDDARYLRVKNRARGMVREMVQLLLPHERERFIEMLDPSTEISNIPQIASTMQAMVHSAPQLRAA